MSLLTGGIGGRGPGETKLELGRRRARERIHRLERELKQLGKRRGERRSIADRRTASRSCRHRRLHERRQEHAAERAHRAATCSSEDKLFATLDPTFAAAAAFRRSARSSSTDTVGFIRDLPKDLFAAFRATFEELEEADLLLHVVDAADPAREAQIRAVERILEELKLEREAAADRVQQVRRLTAEQ